MRLSVIVPVYNVQNYLRECLDSLVAQSYDDMEIICVDDGSTDLSGDILDEYKEIHSNMKVFHKENEGYGKAMNYGIERAQGEYIGFVESDDFADSEMFSELMANVEKDVDVIKANFYSFVNNKECFEELYQEGPYDETINLVMLSTKALRMPCIWSGIYKSSFLKNHSIQFNETKGASYQDVSFWYKVVGCARKAILLKNGYVRYRMDNINSSIHSKDKAFCIFDEFKELETFFEKKQMLYSDAYKKIMATKYDHYISNLRRISYSYKEEYIRKMVCEFSEDYHKGYYDEKLWDAKEYSEMREMVSDVSFTIRKKKEAAENNKKDTDEFWNKIIKEKSIWIYGAGKGGTAVYNLLNRRHVEIQGFLVTQASGDNMFLNKSLFEFDKVSSLLGNSMIIVSVSEKFQKEICEHIEKCNDIKYVLVTPEKARIINEYTD